ncbi:MAG: hypothetical protein ACI9O6_003158 [Glaciecola sp.]|jgi:hypothetical protein
MEFEEKQGKASKNQSNEYKYHAFISYRHADNKEQGRQWATWLHQAIETYDVPADLVGKKNAQGNIIPARIFPIFRDEEELPAHADLGASIVSALEQTNLLIVLCSPRAVASTYVAEEIDYFKKLGHSDRIIAAMIDGEPNSSWDQGKQALGFTNEDECFPLPLQYVYDVKGQPTDKHAEPIAADFRINNNGKPEQGFTTPAAYREYLTAKNASGSKKLDNKSIEKMVAAYQQQLHLMLLKIIAGILGVPLGELTQRDKEYQLEQERLKARRLRQWLGVVVILGILAVIAGTFAYFQKEKANEATRVSIANQLELESNYYNELALKMLNEGDPHSATLLALKALPGSYGKLRPMISKVQKTLLTAYIQAKNTDVLYSNDKGWRKLISHYSYIDAENVSVIAFDHLGLSKKTISIINHDSKDEYELEGELISLKGNNLLLKTEDGISLVDVISRKRMLSKSRVRIGALSSNENFVAVLEGVNIYVYEFRKSDEPIAKINAFIPEATRRSYGNSSKHRTVSFLEFSNNSDAVIFANVNPSTPRGLKTNRSSYTTGFNSGFVKIVDFRTNRILVELEHKSSISGAVLSDFNKFLATKEGDSVNVFNMSKETKFSHQHLNNITFVAFNSDAKFGIIKYLATAATDNNVSIINLAKKSFKCKSLTHSDAVIGMQFSADNSTLITTSLDTISLWNVKKCELITQYHISNTHGLNDEFVSAFMNENGELIVASMHSVKKWNIYKTGLNAFTYVANKDNKEWEIHDKNLSVNKKSSNNKRFFAENLRNSVSVYDDKSKGSYTIKLENYYRNELFFTPDSEKLLILKGETLVIHDLISRNNNIKKYPKWAQLNYLPSINSVRVSTNTEIITFDIDTGIEVKSTVPIESPLGLSDINDDAQIEYSADGSIVAIGNDPYSISIIDFDTKKVIWSVTTNNPVYKFLLLPDNRIITLEFANGSMGDEGAVDIVLYEEGIEKELIKTTVNSNISRYFFYSDGFLYVSEKLDNKTRIFALPELGENLIKEIYDDLKKNECKYLPFIKKLNFPTLSGQDLSALSCS